MTELETKLRAFLKEHGWLPGSLQYMLSVAYLRDKHYRVEIGERLRNYKNMPDDGSLGSLTRNEKLFREAFKEYEQ